MFFFSGIYLEFFKKFQVLRSGKCRSTWNFLSTWKFVGQIWPEMLEIQREIGVKQRIWSKFSACGGPNKREGIKTIDFETGLKKIPGTPKSKKKTLLSDPDIFLSGLVFNSGLFFRTKKVPKKKLRIVGVARIPWLDTVFDEIMVFIAAEGGWKKKLRSKCIGFFVSVVFTFEIDWYLPIFSENCCFFYG